MLNSFVTYFVSEQNQNQQKSIDDFLSAKQTPTQIVATFVEVLENRRPTKWTQLHKAINACIEQHATLIIAELGNLSSKESFVNIMLNADISFYCCDQPFVNNDILIALYKHSQIQKKMHSKLIREGLGKTSAKSGNPNAAEVIGKVNKPKIDAAIVFAFLLQPIVAQYKQQSYSQRQMVKSLNDEGFTAPEGGKWVLSQLQKVLDRVKINEVVMQTKPVVESLLENNFTAASIAEELNKQQIPSLKKTSWDENQVNKILSRLEQIKDIEDINKFVIALLPIMHELKLKNHSSKQILQYLETTDTDISPALTRFKQTIDTSTLAEKLEMAVKHIPTYTKIIKTHITQLQHVLASDQHNNKNLDSINLSSTVKQLMNIFDQLQHDDLQVLEDLQNLAVTWKQEEPVAVDV